MTLSTAINGSANGGGASARAAKVTNGSTGVVARIPTGLKAPLTVSRDSGSTSITFAASGNQLTASIASALAVGSSLSAIARVTQADGAGVLIPVTLTGVAAAPTLSALTLSTSSATVGTAATINIIGATAGSTITGSVPDGMTLNSGARTITGTPTTAGTYNFSLTETLAGATNTPRVSNVSVVVAEAGASVTLSGDPSSATAARSYTFAPEANGGSGTKTYAFSGAVPPASLGGSFNTSTGEITGPFTTAGTVTGAITVTDSSGSATLDVSIPVTAGPSTVAGLMLNLDAGRMQSLSSGVGPVATWSDAGGGSGSATQATATMRPKIGMRQINGRNAMDFDGLTGATDGDQYAVNLSQASGYTIFALVQPDVAGVAKFLFNGATGAFGCRIAATGAIQLLKTGVGNLAQGTVNIGRSPVLLTLKAGSWGSSIRVNGVDDTSLATDAALTAPITSLGGLTSPFNGAIGEFIVFSGNLSAPDVAAMEAYLTAKWITAPSALPASPMTWANGRVVTWADNTPLAWAA